MAHLTISNVRISGISACVPSKVENNATLPIFKNEKEALNVIASTGIERRHIVENGTTASDLSVKAVDKLIDELKWDRESIDCVAYVCQSRDYIAPQTACILQHRLGLRQDCCVFDLPFGCSGFVQGISVVCSMLSHGGLRRAVMICAETNSRNRSMKDKTVRPLFGDAATATALEYSENERHKFNFVFGVDGSRYNAIYTPYGGLRNPVTVDCLTEREIEPGIIRKGTDMVVNGMDVFGFAIKQPPSSIKELINTFSIDTETVDYLLLHQANKFIDEKIRKSINIPPDKVPYCLEEYGNVTSASIPLTLVTRCKSAIENKNNHCIACGFGIGLQWASMEFYVENAVCPDVVIY